MQGRLPNFLTGHAGSSPAVPPHRLLGTFLLIAVLAQLELLATPAPAQDYTLEQIRQKYLENISKIVTMNVRGRLVSNDPRIAKSSIPNPGGNTHWMSDGFKFYHDGTPDNIDAFPMTAGFGNGRQSWTCEYVRGKTEPEAMLLTELNRDEAEQLFLARRHAYGLGAKMGLGLGDTQPNSLVHLTVADLMNSSQCFIRGEKELFGHNCIVIESLDWLPSGQKGKLSFEFVIDPQTGFMPRSITARGQVTEGGDLFPTIEHEVSEMQLVSTPIGDVWFPKQTRGYMHSAKSRRLTSTFEVVDCELNRPIPSSRFIPQFSHPVPVAAVKNHRAYQAIRKGLREARAEASAQLGPSPFEEHQARSGNPPPRSPFITSSEATPPAEGVQALPKKSRLPLILGIVGVLVVVVSTFLRFRV